MKIRTWEQPGWEEARARMGKEKGGWMACRWRASIEGPWYSDSEPEGHGDTEEEARRMALENLLDMHAQIAAFLRENGLLPKEAPSS